MFSFRTGVKHVSSYDGEVTIWASVETATKLVELIQDYAAENTLSGAIYDHFAVHNQRTPTLGIRAKKDILYAILANEPDLLKAIEQAPPIPKQSQSR